MTREQLDEIEKLADGWHRTGLTQYAEEVADNGRALVKALEEAWEDARKQREDALAWLYVSQDRAKERNEARAEVERLKTELKEVREKNGSLADRIEKTDSELRDAWRAEDRLKAVLRLLWEEAQDDDRCHHDHGHLISQPCWEAVTAALKEEE